MLRHSRGPEERQLQYRFSGGPLRHLSLTSSSPSDLKFAKDWNRTFTGLFGLDGSKLAKMTPEAFLTAVGEPNKKIMNGLRATS